MILYAIDYFTALPSITDAAYDYRLYFTADTITDIFDEKHDLRSILDFAALTEHLREINSMRDTEIRKRLRY